jgi:predicted regulator of Ras-like GTPase activity (Roadblock/LC7/MglB family)
MADLDRTLEDLRGHPGVDHVLILGRDGLLVRHLGAEPLDTDTVSAMVPGIATTAGQVGEASGLGDFSAAVVELERGVAVVVALSDELLIALLLQPGVGFAPLLTRVRRDREVLAAAV